MGWNVFKLKMKLSLGTAQFGLDYGVTNQREQVAIDMAKNILDFAKRSNITTLDTASAYGNSEQVLGEIGVEDYRIVTKTIPLADGADKSIDGFYTSLKNLNVEQVDGLLIHNINDIKDKQFNVFFEKLNELKQQNLINKIGFSTYTPEQVDFLLDNFEFDMIQLPFNIFDTRLAEGGQLQALKNKGVEVHSRSVFLQGVLLHFDDLPDYFSTWQVQFDKYRAIVEESRLSLLEYALNFVLNTQEIDKVIVGVNTEKQLREIVQAVNEKSSVYAYPEQSVLYKALRSHI